MKDRSQPPVSSPRANVLQRALKEVLAQQQYAGVVPAPPDYATVIRRAMEIERAWAEAAPDTKRSSA
jgi:hypothetical protein